MKKTLSLFLILVILTMLLTSCGLFSDEGIGRLVANTYINDFANIRFTLPSDWVAQPYEEMKREEPAMGLWIKELFVAGAPEGDPLVAVMIMRSSVFSVTSEQEALDALKDGLNDDFPINTHLPPEAVTLGSEIYSKSTMPFLDESGEVFYLYVRKQDKYIISLFFLCLENDPGAEYFEAMFE